MSQYHEPNLAPEQFQKMLDVGKIQFACVAGHCWLNVPGLPDGSRCEHQINCRIKNPDAAKFAGYKNWSDMTMASYELVERNKDSEWSDEE